MSDTQRSRLFAAEELVWPEDRMISEAECEALVTEFNRVSKKEVGIRFMDGRGHLKLQGGILWVPEWARRSTVLLHELAHTLVWSRFPAHGAEFAARYLALVQAHASPYLAERLREEFDKQHVHYTPEQRISRTRRELVNFANTKPGCLLEVLVDNPPELIVGRVREVSGGAALLDDELVDLARVRYVNHLAAHAETTG